LRSAVGDHDHVVALYQTGPTEEESSRTHLVPPSHLTCSLESVFGREWSSLSWVREYRGHTD
jgi:hypothetical protein